MCFVESFIGDNDIERNARYGSGGGFDTVHFAVVQFSIRFNHHVCSALPQTVFDNPDNFLPLNIPVGGQWLTTGSVAEINDGISLESGKCEHGLEQLRFPDILKVPPLSEYGNVSEIVRVFGGAEKLREAVEELQREIYAV